MIEIGHYTEALDNDLWEVYYTAIHLGCAAHYSPEQLQAWAPDDLDMNIFYKKMREIKPFVASSNGRIVGYADLQPDGYIDHFYVHGKHQGKGVGSALMARIKNEFKNTSRLYSNVSNAAKPFFEKHGFHTIKTQLIEINGQFLENNAMELTHEPTK